MTLEEQIKKMFLETDHPNISFVDKLIDMCGNKGPSRWQLRQHISSWGEGIFKAKKDRKWSLFDRYVKNLAVFIANTQN